jgi:hypothetical protein
MLLKSRGLPPSPFCTGLALARTPRSSALSIRSFCALPIHSPTSSSGSGNQPGLEQAPFSAADFLDCQSQNQSFQEVATVRRLGFNLTGQGAAERIPGMVATPSVF